MPKYSPSQYKEAIFLLGLSPKKGVSLDNQDFIPCPYHSDRTPSLSLDFIRGIYHCFQCGVSGAITGLVWDLKKISISKLVGINSTSELNFVPGIKKSYIEKPKEELPELTVRGIIEKIKNYPLAMQYLEKRHIPLHLIDELNIGYAKEVYINGTLFQNRVIFPITDKNNRVINVEGRAIDSTQTPKVLYPKDSTKILYMGHALDRRKPLYLFEGLIKLLVAQTDSFFKNGSTIMGVGFSDLQLHELKEFNEIEVVPDNDEAGNSLAKNLQIRLSEICSEKKPKINEFKIMDKSIKDIDEIPDKTGLSVQKYREQKGIRLQSKYTWY